MVDFSVDGEVDVPKAESLGPGLFTGGFEVFSRSEEPVVSDDDDVDCVVVEASVDFMVNIQGFKEALDDGDVDRVDS